MLGTGRLGLASEHLLPRDKEDESRGSLVASSLTIASLRLALQQNTNDARRYLILDCCYAAAAQKAFIEQSEATQAMVAQWKRAACLRRHGTSVRVWRRASRQKPTRRRE